MFDWLKGKAESLTSQLWLQKWLGATNKTITDHKVEEVLLAGRLRLSAFAMIAGAWLQTISRILTAASENDVQKMAPILGHFLRGAVSKVSRGLQEEFTVAMAQLQKLELDNWDLILDAWESGESLIDRANKSVERNEASASEPERAVQ